MNLLLLFGHRLQNEPQLAYRPESHFIRYLILTKGVRMLLEKNFPPFIDASFSP